MDEINSPPTEKPTWWDRLCEAFWYTGKGPAVTGLFLVLLVVVGVAWLLLRTPDAPAAEKPDPIEALTTRVEALEKRVALLPDPAAEPTPQPDPVPARPGAPRAALRPTPPSAPESAPSAWGTTDLDRAIAAFPSTTHLEHVK